MTVSLIVSPAESGKVAAEHRAAALVGLVYTEAALHGAAEEFAVEVGAPVAESTGPMFQGEAG